ncbi:FHIPEP family type III secretion protein, partial [Escherichia coli]|uniref:FHIPEP family type III secretion protein n=2 Tax=Pseudomonadota TaxID=1224 RepID=UPI003CFDE080
MPHMVILPAAAIAGFAAWKLRQIANRPAPVVEVKAEPVDQSRIGWDEVTDGMMVNLDIGYGLVPLVDERKGSPLMSRITGVRRQLSKDLG